MRILIVLFMILVAPAKAQQVYKCVKGKDVSYQSAPCDATQTVARQWDATPESGPSDEHLRQRERQLPGQRERVESARPSRVAGTQRIRSANNQRNPNSGKHSMSRCDTAKSRREAKLKAVGLKRTFDLLRKLDDAVNDACK